MFHLGEEKSRPTPGNYPAMNFGYFQIGINRCVNGEQLIVGPKQVKELAQIGRIVHGCPLMAKGEVWQYQ